MSNVTLLAGFEASSTLNDRLHALHNQIMESMPMVDRIAVAIYNQKDDKLRTFVNSTRHGTAISNYEYPLSESISLAELARTGQTRVIDEIQHAVKANNKHSSWLLEQGYHASFTVPIFDQDVLLGFVFFDSLQPEAFKPKIQRDLSLYTNLINLCVANEFSAVKSIMASIQVAREFAHLRDFETGKHLERMARYARLIAQGVAQPYGLSDEFIEKIFLFAPLHDIGKIGIPDHILMKPGKLTPEERVIMKSHVEKGHDIVQRILSDFALHHSPDSKMLDNIICHHHELLDGSGYPHGLKGDDIPIEARIITVADIFDALSSKRHYKSVWHFDAAYDELKHMASDGKLDAACVQIIGTEAQSFKQIAEEYEDGILFHESE
jgi:HD-GYP domain-containing protein (c-di-GMP phosphodiesterase class II)